MTRELVVTLRDGSIISGQIDSPIWNREIKLDDIAFVEYKYVRDYEPSFKFKPNKNYA